MNDLPKLEVHHAEEWAALYINGKLDRVGDAYLATERIYEIVGVRYVQDDAFMRGQTHRDGVAKTLDEVREFAENREQRRRLAAEYRGRAAALEEYAKTFERSS